MQQHNNDNAANNRQKNSNNYLASGDQLLNGSKKREDATLLTVAASKVHRKVPCEVYVPDVDESDDTSNSTSSNSKIDNKRRHKMSYCTKTKCFIFLAMAAIMVALALLIIIFAFNPLDNENSCDTSEQLNGYQLFATKTRYSHAYDHLKLDSSSSKRLNSWGIFSPSDSLATINKRLTEEENCTPKLLHFFGRHAARFPNSNHIRSISKTINHVKSNIDLSEYAPRVAPVASAYQSQDNSIVKQASTATSNETKCSHPLAPYFEWKNYLTEDLSNEITGIGFQESVDTAKRFQSLFPDFFDADKSDLNIAVTDETRTAQTAMAYISLFKNFNVDYCNTENFSFERTPGNLSLAGDVDSNKRCYSELINKYKLDKLSFHEQCKKLNKSSMTHHVGIDKQKLFGPTAESVSKKLKLSSALTTDQVHDLYELCRYEVAIKGNSIWCNLFTTRDLKLYEYIVDIEDYYTDSFGEDIFYKSACAVFFDIRDSLKAFLNQTHPPSPKPQAYFHYTHSSPLERLLAALVNLPESTDYSVDTIQSSFKGTIPDVRNWRTSYMIPFGANIAITLYECRKAPRMMMTSNGQAMDFERTKTFKVVASLNERPIKLDGCDDDFDCDLNKLLTSRFFTQKRCHLPDICSRRYEVD